MFMGSGHVKPGEFDTWLEGAGGTNNGSTENDRTNYWINVPSNALELALFLESDRMGYLLDTMTPQTVDAQRDVVKNERRQSVENQPYGMADVVLGEMLYPEGPSVPLAGHRLHGGPHRRELRRRGGVLQEVLRAVERQPGRRRRHRSRDDAAAGREVVQRREGRARRSSRSTIPGVALTGVQKKTITDRVQLPRLYLAWLTPRHFAPGDAALDVVADVLAGGKNSRLYKRLVYDMQIAQSVSAFQSVAGAVVVVPDRGDAAAGAHGRGAAEGDRRGDRRSCSASRRPTREVAARAQPDRSVVLQPHGARRRLRRQGRSAERATTPTPAIPTGSTRTWRATARCRVATSAPPRRAFLPLGRRVELTVDAGEAAKRQPRRHEARNTKSRESMRFGSRAFVIRVIATHCLVARRRRCRPSRRPIARRRRNAGPAAGAEAAGNPEAAAVERPAGVDRRAARGAGRAGQPRRARAARADDPAGQVRHRQPDGGDARPRARARDRRSKSPTPSTSSAPTSAPTSGIDSSAVRLHVPVARLAEALPIMADVALRPTFPRDELERLRQQRLTALLQARDDPATIAALAFSRVLYGRRTASAPPQWAPPRRSRPSPPTICARSTRPPTGPTNATLIVVGDVTPDKRDAAARDELRIVEGAGRRRPSSKLPAVEQAAARAGLSRRQAGRAAVADPHRLDRRAALDARLLPDPGDEHDPRRLVQLAAEH